jgi:hypothetical protein
MMGTEVVPETSVVFNQFARLISQKDFFILAAVKFSDLKLSVFINSGNFLKFEKLLASQEGLFSVEVFI